MDLSGGREEWSWLAWMEAARVLERMPVTRGLFARGRLSWGQARGIVTRLGRLPVADLGVVDERVAASSEQIDKYSPDELVGAVERAADEIDGARQVERREQRAVEASFVAIQPSFGHVNVHSASGLPDFSVRGRRPRPGG